MSIKRLKTEEEIEDALGDTKPSITIALYDVEGKQEGYTSLAIKVEFNGEGPATPSDLTFAQKIGISAVNEIQEVLALISQTQEEQEEQPTEETTKVKDEIDATLEEMGISSISPTTKH